MKAKMYRFIFSALLICFAAVGNAQTIDGKLYTPFNNYYQWIGGKFNSNLNIPKIAATNGRDTGGIRYNLADSLMYVWTGSQWLIVGKPVDTSSLSNRINLKQNLITLTTTGTSGNATFNQSTGALNIPNYSTDTSSLSSRINERVKYSDTAAMLANYLDYVPTLQQVTTAGNSTTDSINIIHSNRKTIILSKQNLGGRYLGQLQLINEDNTNEFFYANPRFLELSQSGGSANIKWDLLSKSNTIQLPDSSGTITQRVAINGTTYNTASNGVVDLGTISTDTATVVKAYVTNAEAVTITKGQVVYIFGAQGDRASVKLAKNTSDTFSSKTLGIVRADIAAGQAGWVTTQGQVSGINLGAYNPGDILWLDSVAGGFTKTKPEAPYHSVFLGVVERANAGNGLIYVKPQNGVELGELHDVKITSPTNNQVLSYTASTGIWENKTVSASIFAYTEKTTTYTAGAEDYVIHCTSGTFSVNLPTAVGITGKVYIIKNSGSGLITIDPNGSQTIDGSTTYTMSQAETVQVISTGSNWITL